MSGSDLLEHMVCSSLIKSVSSSEKADRPTGSLHAHTDKMYSRSALCWLLKVLLKPRLSTNLWTLPLEMKLTSVLDSEPAIKHVFQFSDENVHVAF